MCSLGFENNECLHHRAAVAVNVSLQVDMYDDDENSSAEEKFFAHRTRKQQFSQAVRMCED